MIQARYRLVDKGNVIGEQVQEFDNLDLALSEQYEGMDILSRENPSARWVEMVVLQGGNG